MNQAVLHYVYDPMCSWCWGFKKTWLQLVEALANDEVEINYHLGGLAPDSDQVMPEELQQTLQGIWRTIHAKLGTEFNFDFWTECQPQRSTYPACRACLIAREEGKEQEMLLAIQQAYYLQAKNPSLSSTLIELAEQVGLEGERFATQLTSQKINTKLMKEISVSRAMPIQGFPSLVLTVGGDVFPIAVDYNNWQKTHKQITQLINNK
ncbi:DsbA family protein [Psychromonas sp. GE-S-Ul-11]|uniref:DsbA family protein n=1 Tax=unclassified Psychromonas TaxID=2614957 RepID=UPI00390CAD49